MFKLVMNATGPITGLVLVLGLSGCAGSVEKQAEAVPLPTLNKAVEAEQVATSVGLVEPKVTAASQEAAPQPISQKSAASASCKTGACNMPGLDALSQSLSAWADPMRASLEQSMAKICAADSKPGSLP